METSRCLDCGAVIGGNNHRAVQGFNVVQLQYVVNYTRRKIKEALIAYCIVVCADLCIVFCQG